MMLIMLHESSLDAVVRKFRYTFKSLFLKELKFIKIRQG